MSKGIGTENNFPNLKEVDKEKVRDEVKILLMDGVRKSIYSYPYSKIQYYGIETAGLLDVDSELTLGFADGIRLVLDFTFKVNIEKICSLISS